MTPYACVVADPAWCYSDTLGAMKTAGQRGVESRYRTTMTLDEICRLAEWDTLHTQLFLMEQPVAANAHLWLWITNPMLVAGWHVAVLRAWNFTPKTMATWVKGRLKCGDLEDNLPPDWSDGAELVDFQPLNQTTSLVQHFAQGRYLRGTTEHCILAVRGQCPALTHSLPSAFVYPGRWPGRLHSEKPPIIHEWAERLSPGPRVELFARRTRPGWDAVGDELTRDTMSTSTEGQP